ncbi:MAG TPA: flagellar basal-body MS-ring/collar protein FliF [Armatimonadota bacterium]|nr:flagellar basal-body MS-ring/collar protein FliF [Armatimonadota bacterium]
MSEGGTSIGDIGRAWQNATSTQRLGLGAFAVICLGLLALVGSLARQPHYGVLYANLRQEDAAAVVQRLRDMKVAYRVTGSGTIEAPADTIHEVRLDLAAEALPGGGQSGFELFDRTRLGLTDFGERMNYQRALQGELARTIAHLDSVEQARVHVALPTERLYTSEQGTPTASVVLKLQGAQGLNAAQVKSIVHLVSGAVEGLDPESVAVLDTRGRLLSNPADSGPGGTGLAAASNQLQLRREYEREIEAAVQSMLDGVLGAGKSVVRASAELIFESVEQERETYEPVEGGSGVLESRRDFRETYRGLGEGAAIGVPGVSSNTGASASKVAVKQGQGADEYEQSEVTAQYLVSRQRERRVQPPGQVKQLSLSVFIDEGVELGEGEDLSGAVSAAAGLDPTRGDAVVITRMPFQPPAPEEKGSKAYAIRDFYFRAGRDFAAIVIAALFLHFAFGLLRRQKGVGPASRPRTEAMVHGSQSAAAHGSQTAAAAPVPEVEIDPERAAAVLRTWLSSDEQPGGDGGLSEARPAGPE